MITTQELQQITYGEMKSLHFTEEEFKALYDECRDLIILSLKDAASRGSRTNIVFFYVYHDGYSYVLKGLAPLLKIWNFDLGIGPQSNAIQQDHNRDEKIRELNRFLTFFTTQWKQECDVHFKLLRASQCDVSIDFVWSLNP